MKNAIVTGSSRGLGKSIAIRLAQEGYHVCISARNEKELKALASYIDRETAGSARWDVLDYSDPSQASAYGQSLLHSLDGIDILVNNVGIYTMDEVIGDMHELDLQLAVNFRSPFELTQNLLGVFKDQGSGSIFNIASVVNRYPRSSAASYSIAKAAFYAYHRLLHQSLKPHGIKVTAFLPASVNTSSWEGIDAPKEGFIQPEDIAALIVTLHAMRAGTVVSEIDVATIHPDY